MQVGLHLQCGHHLHLPQLRPQLPAPTIQARQTQDGGSVTELHRRLEVALDTLLEAGLPFCLDLVALHTEPLLSQPDRGGEESEAAAAAVSVCLPSSVPVCGVQVRELRWLLCELSLLRSLLSLPAELRYLDRRAGPGLGRARASLARLAGPPALLHCSTALSLAVVGPSQRNGGPGQAPVTARTGPGLAVDRRGSGLEVLYEEPEEEEEETLLLQEELPPAPSTARAPARAAGGDLLHQEVFADGVCNKWVQSYA